MSSTNHTANYNLPQFVGTDKPAWLGDINPAMTAIDGQMKTNADGVANILSMLNLTSRSSKQGNTLANVPGLSISGVLHLAQNTDGSIFKFYNFVTFTNTTDSNVSIPLVPIPGFSGIYGLKTLQLNQAPTEAYAINAAGTAIYEENEGTTLQDVNLANIFVGSDGYIYILGSYESTWGLHQHQMMRDFYSPCLYFNANFGDE